MNFKIKLDENNSHFDEFYPKLINAEVELKKDIISIYFFSSYIKVHNL